MLKPQKSNQRGKSSIKLENKIDMKKLLIIFFVIPYMALGQLKEHKYDLGLKLYAKPGLSYSHHFYNLEPLRLTPAISLSKNSNKYFEIGVQELTFNGALFNNLDAHTRLIPAGDYYQRNMAIGLYAEQNYKLVSSKNERWDFYLGPRIETSFSRLRFKPISPEYADLKFNQLSLGLGITPRVGYNLSKRLELELSAPITYNIRYYYGAEYDPSGIASTNPIRYNDVNSRFNANVRLGLKINLFK